LRGAIPDQERREKAYKRAPAKHTRTSRLAAKVPTILDRVDLSQELEKDEYAKRLKQAQVKLRKLMFECYDYRVPVIAVFEGWDAGGKGGVIKRLVTNLDPRSYDVNAVAAPTDEELRHHYLWRFWKGLPKAGHLGIFDRSWYGRVLVERIEGFCSEEEWNRAYREICEFERQLADFGTVVTKYWLHISKDEQLRRFKEREANPFKRYKITDEDWRNRERWDLYKVAVSDMLERTSTTYAPWTVVEGNCKYFARVKTIETLNDAIKTELRRRKRTKS